MLLSRRTARRAVAGAIGVGAITSDPSPNCTGADLAGVSSGVAAATSTYLFTHPDVNNFFTGLKGQPKDQIRDNVSNYLNANPQVKSELQDIRKPLVDLKTRCQ
jgi:hemophore-related protein